MVIGVPADAKVENWLAGSWGWGAGWLGLARFLEPVGPTGILGGEVRQAVRINFPWAVTRSRYSRPACSITDLSIALQ
jgi:hypothetical protein